MTRTSVAHLPMSRKEMTQRGWSALDILLVSGDDYFDSPTHGIALIGRVLESHGFRVGIITRPNWKQADALLKMGTPSLFVGIGAGAVDSTLNNYTADLAPRKKDVYASNANTDRPNFATAVYCSAAKSAFPGVPIVLGGVEASTRRFAYYDYLKKKIRRSVLVDTRADILVFGSGEKPVVEIAQRLHNKKSIIGITGTALLTREPSIADAVELPPYNALCTTPALLIEQTRQLENGLGPHKQTAFCQTYQEGIVLAYPPAAPTSDELDAIHALPFLRTPHPQYKQEIPAAIPVRWSVVAQRGCPGGCSFCALAYHQGRQVISRSESSIISELKKLSEDNEFNGTITDVGGPTANAYGIRYTNAKRCSKCNRVSCFHPNICNNIETSHERFIQLMRTARKLPGIKHLFIASGIRHDLALHNRNFIALLAEHFTGGHLKVAPEHTDNDVLRLMRKPPIEMMEQFEKIFMEAGRQKGREQYLVPYFIAGFPGCTAQAANGAGKWLRRRNQHLQQVQNFIPLPGTMAAAMYAAALDENGKSLYIPHAQERKRQKNLLLGENLRTGRSAPPKRPYGKKHQRRKK